MQYTVIVHNADEGGYWVEVPSLPGCFSQGETIDDAMNNVKEAIELHIQGLRDEGAGSAVPRYHTLCGEKAQRFIAGRWKHRDKQNH